MTIITGTTFDTIYLYVEIDINSKEVWENTGIACTGEVTEIHISNTRLQNHTKIENHIADEAIKQANDNHQLSIDERLLCERLQENVKLPLVYIHRRRLKHLSIDDCNKAIENLIIHGSLIPLGNDEYIKRINMYEITKRQVENTIFIFNGKQVTNLDKIPAHCYDDLADIFRYYDVTDVLTVKRNYNLNPNKYKEFGKRTSKQRLLDMQEESRERWIES